MPPKKKKAIGFPLQSVGTTAEADKVTMRCRGFHRHGNPCRQKMRPDTFKAQNGMCKRHMDDPKQGEKEERGRRLHAEGKRLTVPFKQHPKWYEVEMMMRDNNMEWRDFVKTLDPEELARGDVKDKDGEFHSNGAPAWVPSAFHQACVAELMIRGKEIYRTHYLTAIRYFTAVVEDEKVDANIRLRAAQYIWERLEGKIPDRVEYAEAAPWQEALADAIVSEDEMIERARVKLQEISDA
jgi:hypothetical protein